VTAIGNVRPPTDELRVLRECIGPLPGLARQAFTGALELDGHAPLCPDHQIAKPLVQRRLLEQIDRQRGVGGPTLST
jgi:hypothetical protein